MSQQQPSCLCLSLGAISSCHGRRNDQKQGEGQHVDHTMKTIRADGVEIASAAFGDPSVSLSFRSWRAMASILWWSGEFYHNLAAKRRHVISYYNRDTGLSIKYIQALRHTAWTI